MRLENSMKKDGSLTNSLNSLNFSSPMQTSTDICLDSELLSTDIASNDSQSPKNIEQTPNFTYKKPEIYNSNDSLLSNDDDDAKSNESLINSGDSCNNFSSPLRKNNRDYNKKVQRKHKKKYFGVKTLQSIFSKQHDGYSDISSTASEFGDEMLRFERAQMRESIDVIDDKRQTGDVQHNLEMTDFEHNKPKKIDSNRQCYEEKKNLELTIINNMEQPEHVINKLAGKKSELYIKTSPQFEDNIHTIISDIFVNKTTTPDNNPAATLTKATGTKKYFSLHGHNLRVGKALRLCPNDDFNVDFEKNEQRKEKLLARYVYNANSLNGDGVGDPDFGTPV